MKVYIITENNIIRAACLHEGTAKKLCEMFKGGQPLEYEAVEIFDAGASESYKTRSGG